MRLSVVTTLYQSSPYILEFHQRVRAVIQKPPGKVQYDIIFVDDGSPDNSLSIATKLFKKEKNIKIVALSRNFGHSRAILTGLSYATGDLIFLIDSDLEEPPEILIDLYKKWSAPGSGGAIDVAYARQDKRKGRWFEKISGTFFWRLFNWLTDVQMPPNPMTARLMTRRYVRSLLLHEERELFLAGLLNITGYRQEPVLAKKGDKGKSTYTFQKKLSLTINAITSFSHMPLIFIFVFGTAVSLLSLGCIFWVLFSKVIMGITYLSGWASLILITCFFGGLSLSAIGAVGIYLGKVFVEVKKRPCIIMDVFPRNMKRSFDFEN